MSPRLDLALQGGLDLPDDDGRILLLYPTGAADLSGLPLDRCLAVQPFLPDLNALRGVEAVPELPEGEKFAAAIVFLPRSKDLARALIARAATVTDGTIAVDGAKTDGIESVLKDLKRRASLKGTLSKAHGKIAWFQAEAVFDDWHETPRHVDGFETRPGVFSADAIDPASAILADHLPDDLGRYVADLGAGWGYLARQILTRNGVRTLDLVEADHRALGCARRNVDDPRAHFHWADARNWRPEKLLDSVVTNPPFHVGRAGEPALGQAFITAAAEMMTPSGRLWLVANRHLPYEAILSDHFGKVDEIGGDGRFKVLYAERPSRRRR